MSRSVDTTQLSDGSHPFDAQATSAAGNTVTISKTALIDNSVPAVSPASPADFPNSGAAASVAVSATSGLSGVKEIDCNVDGRSLSFPQGGNTHASATVPVAGLGAHTFACQAENEAVDPNGTPGLSPVATSTVTLRDPTALSVHFLDRADRLRCHRAFRRVRVPAGWHRIRWHGHLIRARLPAHYVRRRVEVCHQRLVRRRIVVYRTVRRRHGHKLRTVRIKRHKIVRVPVAPHTVGRTVRRVAYGRHTSVSGWLGTTRGVALRGQAVTLLGAPDNGRGAFRAIGHAVTRANGSWTARVPRGPSRLLQVAYGGSPTDEPTGSGQAKTIVHAEVRLAPLYPRRVAWGSKITLAGQLPGGHVPRSGINIRLRYGIGRQKQTYGVREHIGTHHSKRFKAHFHFGPGPVREHVRFFFQLCTLPSGDYPYAPGCSPRQTIAVGGHPAARRHRVRGGHRHRTRHHRTRHRTR